MKKGLFVCLMLAIIVLAGCGGRTAPAPPPTPLAMPTREPPTPTPVPETDEEAIWQLLNAEKEGVVQQDIDRLLDIWDEDGVITDVNHTPDDPSDDSKWEGHDAIRERYVTLVFPSAPEEAAATEADITVKGNTATATSTTSIGKEVSPGGDKWTFEKKEGRWKITTLTYNLEPE